MKIKADFITNSSSSSFVIFNHNHLAVKQLIEEGRIKEGDKYIEDEYDDNEIWDWCYDNGYDWEEFLEQISFDG